MENAVDALKIAFAIIVFALAIALTFSVISNIRHTSDVLFEMSDPNKYYIDDLEGYTYITSNKDVNGNVIINRSVGAETIIPTIYRYYKENFGVTIIVDGNPIARYDLDTENIMNNWQTNSEETNKKHIDYLNTYINPTRLNPSTDSNIDEEWWRSYIDIKSDISQGNTTGSYNLPISQLYITQKGINNKNKIATPWIGSERKILDRINADIYAQTIQFDSNVKYKGKNLLNTIGNEKKFKEYFVFVPAEDINKTDKLEIIYVKE